MSDQANNLRKLVLAGRRPALDCARADGPPPRMLAVAGAKGGVGCTSVAVNLALALASQGLRTVLIDADLNGADVATMCRLPEQHTLADVLAGRRDVHEALVRGPGGIQVLPGAWASRPLKDAPPAAQDRLLEDLAGLGRHIDFVVLDVGCGVNSASRRFWNAADEVLMVASTDRVALMDAYAAVKLLTGDFGQSRIRMWVNLAPDGRTAEDAHRRLSRACWRFLGIKLRFAGWWPAEPAIAAAAQMGSPIMLASPACAAAGALEKLAFEFGSVATENSTNQQIRFNPCTVASRS